MAMIIEKKKRKKIPPFLILAGVFLLIGVLLGKMETIEKFWIDLSLFASCTTIMIGIVHAILHKVRYITGKKNRKTERRITLLFYIGIASIILQPIAILIFKEEHYMGISPFEEIFYAILFCTGIGEILFLVSIAMMWKKYRKIINLFKPW